MIMMKLKTEDRGELDSGKSSFPSQCAYQMLTDRPMTALQLPLFPKKRYNSLCKLSASWRKPRKLIAKIHRTGNTYVNSSNRSININQII